MTTTAASPPRAWHAFSFRRLAALTGNTLTQLIRTKILYFLIVFFLIVTAAGFFFPTYGEQDLKLFKDVFLAGMSWFTLIFAITATAMLIPKDVEDRTLYTILCKPVPRLEYLLGRLLGVLCLIGISLALMDGVCTAILQLKAHLNQETQLAALRTVFGAKIPIDEITRIEQLYARQGPTWDLQTAVLGIFCQSSVMAAISLLLSTFASSSLFTILSSFAVFVIGHGQSLLREHFFSTQTLGPTSGILSLLLSLLSPDLKQFNHIDAVVAGSHIPWQLTGEMTGLALLYLGGYLAVSWLIFSGREL